MPAVLVEVSFLSNPAEEARLAQRQYLEANGEAIFRGLLRFYGAAPVVTPIVEPPSPTPPPPAAPEIQPPPERAPTVIAPDPPRGQEPRTSDPQMDSSTDARANSEARPPPRFSTGVKVAAAFLAALGLAALLAWWLLSRKLRREALRPPPTPPSGGPRILVVKGPGCGHRVEVGSGWCEVGRDPSSGLVIASAETTAHVARRHCRVRFDEVARQFDLECLSANGVQLAGGLRLEHGESARIHPGQTLLLGEQTMVRVLAEEGAAERRRAHIVGRSVFCDVVLDDESVSEVHAELTVDGNGTILVADCGSSNGTWLVRSGSEQAIKVRPVAMTDHVRFGGDEHSVAGLLARLGSGADHLVERKRKERVR
jgi:pSer/pThr/pTyr-binding forkhead associated (FHA) protein